MRRLTATALLVLVAGTACSGGVPSPAAANYDSLEKISKAVGCTKVLDAPGQPPGGTVSQSRCTLQSGADLNIVQYQSKAVMQERVPAGTAAGASYLILGDIWALTGDPGQLEAANARLVPAGELRLATADASAPTTGKPSQPGGASAQPEGGTTDFKGTYAYPDGVQLKVVEIRHGEVGGEEAELNEDDSSGGGPFVVFTIEVKNGTSKSLKTGDISQSVSYGPKRKTADTTVVEDTAEEEVRQSIRPREVITVVSSAYLIPTKYQDDVVMRFRFKDKVHKTAVFAGSVR